MGKKERIFFYSVWKNDPSNVPLSTGQSLSWKYPCWCIVFSLVWPGTCYRLTLLSRNRKKNHQKWYKRWCLKISKFNRMAILISGHPITKSNFYKLQSTSNLGILNFILKLLVSWFGGIRPYIKEIRETKLPYFGEILISVIEFLAFWLVIRG